MRIKCKIIQGYYAGKFGIITGENDEYYFISIELLPEVVIFPKTGYIEITE